MTPNAWDCLWWFFLQMLLVLGAIIIAGVWATTTLSDAVALGMSGLLSALSAYAFWRIITGSIAWFVLPKLGIIFISAVSLALQLMITISLHGSHR
jgi:hypothetical protein